ncbi:MAG: UDP-glucose 4-epimerase GalE [Alphaproteobacteria bacterium]|nr:UDP-glucose 4-epimerase GalE [Alphaproteobacteria bacterium]
MTTSSTKTVLVTGGAGYIGSHCCKLLSRHGYEPVVYDNLTTGNRKAVKWGALVEGDVRDRATLLAALTDHAPVAVLHFAASAYVGESVAKPAKYYNNNIGGMLSLLDCCREAGVGRIVFSSSCATYGIPDHLPITEATSQQPINPYGRTKLICEGMLQDYAHAYGLRYVALRYFNAAGADPEAEIGEWHTPETHLIPRAMLAASAQQGPLEIFGDDYPTGDGTCIRDYIHVSDLAEAHVLALRHLLSGGHALEVNLGTGTGHSIYEVLSAIKKVTGREVPVALKPRRPGDPPVLVASAERARQTLSFVPKLSDLDTIIATASPFFGLECRQ